ncbi:MAG: serine/threonine-protein kinase [Actinomycetia bacterium]|nr:serine/threonine-protein kinase [Actinomycetes bacterium]
MIGKSLAHYEITELLGKGGMGEVYRARDTKLGRDVALKILPRELSGDPERIARFQREARSLATLQHQNIASIYDFEDAAEARFLVMELVEGEDLESRLEREGAVPVDEALKIAIQIASGLEAAHEQGIIHRDLKPANVKVGVDGTTKVLDFGLARAFADPESESDPSLSPTITAAMTQAGMILGTAAYMSPEQARGKRLDKRTDIWSFGIILYEMLTGTRLYEGETITDILTGILHLTPDLAKLPPSTPSGVRRLLARCLDKDPAHRLRDIGEVRIALSPDSLAEPELDLAETVAGREPSRRARLPWIVAALATVGAAVLGWIAIEATSRPPAGEIRAAVLPPEGGRFFGYGSNAGSLTLSPDGTKMTFTVPSEDSAPQLYLRSLESEKAQLLAGTEGATFPFWSPDGRQLAFFVGGKLKKLSLDGGAPITICDAPDGRGGSWNQYGQILLAPGTESPIHLVPAAGGTPSPITKLDPARANETTHRYPVFLPDGKSYLFLRASHSAASSDPGNSIWVGYLDSAETYEIMHSPSNAAYARGHLFWVNDGFLMARPFDPASRKLTGDAFPVGEDILLVPTYWRGAFGVSNAGILAFQHGFALRKILTWFDREGNRIDSMEQVGLFGHIRLSPAGDRLAASLSDENSGGADIWVFDVRRKVASRLTFSEGNDTHPVWSPDGNRIAFHSNRDGPGNIYSRSADGRGEAELLFSSDIRDEPWGWSPDGKYLTFNHSVSRNDLWILSLETGEASEFISSEYDDGWGLFSPDGNWLAYLSNESGKYDLYLTRFPSGDGKWQLSTQGADWLLGWNATGDELYYLDLSGSLASVKVRLGELVEIDMPKVHFQTQSGDTWANTSDGQRFLLGVPEDTNAAYPITLVIHWQGAR